MTDQEIRERRVALEAMRKGIHDEWKIYDGRYPVIVGAYKPPDYDRQQLRFVERLREVDRELAALPTLKVVKLRRFLIAVVVIGVALLLAWRLF